MRKRILVKEAGFMDFIKSFFRAKVDGTEDKWLSAVKKKDAELGKVWQNYNDAVDQKWNTIHSVMKKRGIDTTDVETFMKDRGVKIDSTKSL